MELTIILVGIGAFLVLCISVSVFAGKKSQSPVAAQLQDGRTAYDEGTGDGSSSAPPALPSDVISGIISDGLFTRKFEDITREIHELAEEKQLSMPDVIEAVRGAVLPVAHKALQDGILSDFENARIQELLDAYEIAPTELDEETKTLLVNGTLVRNLISGTVAPSYTFPDNPFKFMKSEILVWAGTHIPMSAVKTVSRIEGGSQGVSIRIMKGVYWRVGKFAGERVSHQELQELGSATVAVTSKHLYYGLDFESKRIRHDKIVGIKMYSDAVMVTPDGARAKPLLFHVDDPWLFSNVVQNAQNWDVQ